jgi:hypothetical protein
LRFDDVVWEVAMHQTSKFAFVVKETGAGVPWIALEPAAENLPALGEGNLGLDLVDGASMADAQEVARVLNRHVKQVSYWD